MVKVIDETLGQPLSVEQEVGGSSPPNCTSYGIEIRR